MTSNRPVVEQGIGLGRGEQRRTPRSAPRDTFVEQHEVAGLLSPPPRNEQGPEESQAATGCVGSVSVNTDKGFDTGRGTAPSVDDQAESSEGEPEDEPA